MVHLRVIDYGMGFGHPAAANESEDRIMPYTKEATQRKRRTNALPVRCRQPVFFACYRRAGVNPDPATSALVAEQVMDEEQISDVSLATFHVLDNEGGSTRRLRARPTVVSQGACGADLYLPQNPPAVSGPVYQAPPPPRPRPTRPASKYRRSWLARDTDGSNA